jgi:hypothetical protein
MTNRFIIIENNPEFPTEIDPHCKHGGTRWWWDIERPVPEKERDNPYSSYIAVQTYLDQDPNNFIRHDKLFLVFQDQAEYYYVCANCRDAYSRTQWSGSTRGSSNWRERAERHLEKHIKTKGWCQFCDPIFGNGGWRLD